MLCTKCLKDKNKLTRGYCATCYSFLRRKGLLDNLPKKLLPDFLTPIQEDVLIGGLLGDACLYKHKSSHNAHLALVRSLKDKEYALWQADIFKEFITRITETSCLDKRTGKVYYHIKPISHACPALNTYYDEWYIDRKKRIPKNLELSPLSLAVWFADDGHCRKANSPWRIRVKFSTQGFVLEDVEFLSDLLFKRYNEIFPVHKVKQKQYIIQTSDNASRAFLKEIDDYLPPGLERKAYWRKPEARFYEDVPQRSFDYKRTRILIK